MMEQMDVVNTVAQPKRVPLFTCQSTPTTFSTIKVKSKCFFLFLSKSTGFIDQQADVGQENKKRCNWAGPYRRRLLSHSSRSSFETLILVILLQKLWWAILRWYCFLFNGRMEGLLMTGEGSQDL